MATEEESGDAGNIHHSLVGVAGVRHALVVLLAGNATVKQVAVYPQSAGSLDKLLEDGWHIMRQQRQSAYLYVTLYKTKP